MVSEVKVNVESVINKSLFFHKFSCAFMVITFISKFRFFRVCAKKLCLFKKPTTTSKGFQRREHQN